MDQVQTIFDEVSQPQSIFEETVRVHGLKLVFEEAGFRKYMSDGELDDLVSSILWSNLDVFLTQEQLIADLLKTIKWMCKMSSHDIDIPTGNDLEMLSHGIRKFGDRLDRKLDDDPDGAESWKDTQ